VALLITLPYPIPLPPVYPPVGGRGEKREQLGISRILEAISKPVFPVTLREAKGLRLLGKARFFASLRMTNLLIYEVLK
jgi:hypothetical protein